MIILSLSTSVVFLIRFGLNEGVTVGLLLASGLGAGGLGGRQGGNLKILGISSSPQSREISKVSVDEVDKAGLVGSTVTVVVDLLLGRLVSSSLSRPISNIILSVELDESLSCKHSSIPMSKFGISVLSITDITIVDLSS